MTNPTAKLQIEITDQGYLHLSADVAQTYFPQDVLIALARPPELWLMPTRGPESGGLLLKQRNKQGDRSVVIWEALPPQTEAGVREAFWDEQRGALRAVL
ncbi:MAG: hydrogenase maturation protease [Pseudomonadota bacterium]